MCGRYAFYSPHESVVRLFGVKDASDVEPRYNIAPTQYVAAVREDAAAGRQLRMLYWGLVPSWAREKSIGARMINARGETLAEKPSFRSAYRRRRCLVPADGYYEWRRMPSGKQPYFISLASGEPFAMAGLWERWRDPGTDEPLESCAIITTSAAGSLAHLHDRMPVILPRTAYDEWLDPTNEQTSRLERLIVPYASEELAAHPVNRRVNNARNEGPDLIEPSAEGA